MEHKTALITGASRGIGRAIACAFASAGYDLFLTCLRSEESLKQLCRDLSERFGVRAVPFCGDMGDFAAVQSLFSGIRRLDVLVNNAGISHIGLLSDMSPEEWRRIMATNLDSCFYTCKLAVPLMVHEKRGKILNISSVWGSAGASMEAAYSASKGAVNSLTKALAKELAPSNIQVNAIACGVIDTDMNRCFSEEEMRALIEEIPADRLGSAEEVAALALQLAGSPSYLTGQIIALDGGFL
ncbi:MAG TPA: SDR family NAD(P)-dependent oxidoreductase [Candidatus Eisenbergiella merdigallinarum]|uniref:SDR family NAD(P)-dependent oxidoreductase n=1 Tax=Candidatus Eisenbergiella merdigallinarum TaxID=2838552 RepID=A0A9D2MTV9_9FIRM|nr:SDR family NAD(P)-dependent oxidoreductase [Candidatus Eisenbergiella merdigallinarum]